MLISRCAWHAFFRGYPRALGVVSWRGRGVAFSDTICRSCADRVRIEGLWGSAPPPPVWPGSAQTALLFVGLPLLTALVLLASPLHDAPPPVTRQEAAAPVSASAAEPLVAAPEPRPAAMPRAVARRAARESAAPAVIYEVRRSGPPPVGPAARPESIRLATVPAGAEARISAASLGTQSP